MNEDKIKEAFLKAKQDISSLNNAILSLKQEIESLKQLLYRQTNRQTNKPTNTLTDISTENLTIQRLSPTQNLQIPTQNQSNQTIQHINPTENPLPTDNPTDNNSLKPLKSPNFHISTGNKGVPTDRQTDQQTDTSTGNKGVKVRLIQNNPLSQPAQTQLQKVSDFITSLDDIKQELKSKFKKTTKQEMAVFATIYQLEEEGLSVDYLLLSQRLKLSESSARDYTMKLISKDIPITKTKENNKKIFLSISPELKKIASLSTILELKEQ
jgi:hypothetical protein